MKKTSRILCLLLLSFTMIISMTSTNALVKSRIQTVASVLEFDIDLSSKINLYDKNDEVIAHLYKSNTNGYLIVNSITDKPIEYSNESNLNFFENTNLKYYYNGPCCYFVEEGENIKDQSGTLYSKDYLTFSTNNKSFNVASFKKVQSRALTTISHVPRNYSYNESNICASTASAILLMYYNDYVNQNYVPAEYESSGTGQVTVNYVKQFVNQVSGGASLDQIEYGLNLYLDFHGFSNNVTRLSKNNVQSPIGANRPGLITVSGHPTYCSHVMVIYGYNRYVEGTDTIYMLLVVDGLGNTGVYVDRDYCTAGFRIS